ncbi:MAG: hypothetical protein DYG89_22960 [Caldilinea sp. CFX5]|nr:hypothetical protein [Caldilinea sp. CFX5]
MSEGQAPRTQRHVENWLLIVILLLAAGLRFYRLDGSSLWSDEGNTWALLGRSFAQIAQDAAADIHPPGYYWLLKLWSMVAGTSAWGMRSFSALVGVLLVYIIYRLGCVLEREQPSLHGVALLATLIAALNPFQIYYSQEARMYLLLALVSATLFWALSAFVTTSAKASANWLPPQPTVQTRLQDRSIWPAIGYVLSGVAGLWTHYSFPIVLAAAGLAFLVIYLSNSRITHHASRITHHAFWRFVGLNALILLAYLPWLPTAIERVLNWPQGGESITLTAGLQLTLRTLLFGPLREAPHLPWPWLLVAGLLPLWALARQWRQISIWPPALWFLAPIGLMFGLGLFSDAFLKFLLTASPAWALLTAVGIRRLPKPRIGVPLAVAGALAVAALTLPTYYTSPTVRDNYAGIARYLQATAPPAALVILDAPGQQEVWQYYTQLHRLTVPALALPQQRPPDPAATVATLQRVVANRSTLYALFWATDEADPERLVERWLDQHTFKGLESWQGNLRFVTYVQPTTLGCTALPAPPRFGEAILLTALCQPTTPQTVAAGEVALVGLRWQTEAALTERYKVTVQVLDSRNNVIAQRDSEPVGGSLPTAQWPVGATVTDNHGVFIPPGTPPGVYRVIAALYDQNSGQRLLLPDSHDHLSLGKIQVVRPAQSLPATLLPLQQLVQQKLGPLQLVGYSAHRKGMAHAPATPVVAGDLVEFTFFWQAPAPLPPAWPDDLSFTLTLGDQTVTMPVAGDSYPTGHWQAAEIVRSKAELLYTGQGRRPQLTIGADTLSLQRLPGGAWWSSN